VGHEAHGEPSKPERHFKAGKEDAEENEEQDGSPRSLVWKVVEGHPGKAYVGDGQSEDQSANLVHGFP